MHELQDKKAILETEFRIGDWSRYDYDLEAGALTFSENVDFQGNFGSSIGNEDANGICAGFQSERSEVFHMRRDVLIDAKIDTDRI